MWRSGGAVVRRSSSRGRYPSDRWIAALPSFDYSIKQQQPRRGFSDSRGRGGGGRGGGAGRGAGGRGQHGGWRNNQYDDTHESRHGRRPKKTNFAKQFLEPAARGELKHHRSGIPKLTGRRPKAHGVKAAEPFWTDDDMGDIFGEDDTTPVDIGPAAPEGEQDPDKTAEEEQELAEFEKQYKAIINSEDKEEYYWNENDYSSGTKQALERLISDANLEDDFAVEVGHFDPKMFDLFEGVDFDEESEITPAASEGQGEKGSSSTTSDDKKGGRHDTPTVVDDFPFVMDEMGIKYGREPHDPETYDRVEPLKLNGPSFDDFIVSMMKHPTKYAEYRLDAERPESLREPIPVYPPGRKNPSLEFVEGNFRFIYVWGLPLLMVDGKVGNLDNPIHHLEMQKTIADLFDVEVDQVSVASLTSAFVGFHNKADFRFAVEIGPKENIILSPAIITKYTPDKDFPLASENSSGTLVLIQNLPVGWDPVRLARDIFPEGTEIGDYYGKNLTADDIVMNSPTSAVLRLESPEMADSAIQSSMVQERLKEVGEHTIQYNKARRNLVYTGFHGGPENRDRLRKLGPKLIVDGDMPKKKFFLSHAEVLHLRGLDSSLSKQEISDFFQPFCDMQRDVEGSVDFVTSREGFPTGSAYIGFDELGEGQEALQALSAAGGKIEGLGRNRIFARFVKDLNPIAREKRQKRKEEELLDSLRNWEQYVDPADLELLYEHGISKEALDETFTSIRYQNPTFSNLDQSMRSEAINPEKEVGGMYRELVQTYVAELKDCLSTPEDPGFIYESLFAQGEEIDTEIFENEPLRQEELKKKRGAP